MITDNKKRLEIENLQDAMRIAKQLLRNGYQVYMNIEDDIGDGKIIVVIEYEWLDDDLADGRYIYKSYYDDAHEEDEDDRQKKDKETNEDYIWGHEEGYQEGWTAGYNARMGEETPDDDKDNDDYNDDYSNWSEEHRKWFDRGYNAGYTTAKYDFCDCPEDDQTIKSNRSKEGLG